jgi:hypothetical protein
MDVNEWVPAAAFAGAAWMIATYFADAGGFRS